MVVDKINEYLSSNELTFDYAIQQEVEKLSGWAFKRQFMEQEEFDSTGKIWMSGVGKCPRQLAYAYHGFDKEGKEIDSRSKIVFWMGDLVEIAVIKLAKLAGVPLIGTGLDQARLSLSLNGKGKISGRPDGFIVSSPMRVLSVKSMPSFRFRKFEKGDIEESYIAQSNIEMSVAGLTETVMVAICKDSGVLGERTISLDEEVLKKIRSTVKQVAKSTKDKLPEPAYEADEKGFYPWQCLYCSYWKHCRTNAEKIVVSGKYKLKEKESEG